ncbi:MAG: hypothetical protein U9R34_04850 [Nanoarchaeota archaeon]|nr:hypothetical protein [Nanoarchaeota archaeon]
MKSIKFHTLFFILSLVILIFLFSLFTGAVDVDTTESWHPLQEVARSSSDMTMVDENQDGIIDKSETLELEGGVAKIGDGTVGTALAIDGSNLHWSALDFYMGGFNIWGMGRNSEGNFYIDKYGVGNALTIDVNRNVGIGTTSPGSYLPHTLAIYDSLNFGLQSGLSIVSGSNAMGRISFADGDSGLDRYRGSISYDHASDRLYFNANAVTIMSLKDGKVGIGTTSPEAELEVAGSIRAERICDESGNNCKDISKGWALKCTYVQVESPDNGDATCGSIPGVSAHCVQVTIKDASTHVLNPAAYPCSGFAPPVDEIHSAKCCYISVE